MSSPRSATSTPLAVRTAHASVWVSLAAVLYSAVVAEWWWLAAAALVVAATFGRAVVRGGALLVALLLGAWPAAVAAGLSLVASAMTAGTPWALRHRRRPLDVAALTAAVQALPVAERRKIEQAARGPVDSMAIVRAALADDPSRWPFPAADLEGSAYDGGPVGDLRWTVVACEAALVAGCRPDSHIPLDVHHLAGAAMLLPNTAAGVRLGRTGHAVEKALGLSDGQTVELLVRAVGRPGGELIERRVDLLAGPLGRWSASGEMTELPEEQWRRLIG